MWRGCRLVCIFAHKKGPLPWQFTNILIAYGDALLGDWQENGRFLLRVLISLYGGLHAAYATYFC